MRRLFLVLLLSVTPAVSSVASDGVVEINQACAVGDGCLPGDLPGFPVTIAGPGSYRLTGNLNCAPNTSGITISGDDVTVDLNGFGIQSSSPSPVAGGIVGTGSRISVHNGTIIDFYTGIALTGPNALVERLRIKQPSLGDTILVGSSCRVINSAVSGGYNGSVVTGDLCVIEGNTITGGGDGPALVTGNGALIRGNTVTGIDGAIVAPNSIVTGNRASAQLDGPAIFVLGGGVISENIASSSGGPYTIYSSNSVVSNNRVSGWGVGIKCADCTVSGNSVYGFTSFALDATGGTGTTGYHGNQFNGNNGGNANPQVLGGVETGPNVCGGDLICP